MTAGNSLPGQRHPISSLSSGQDWTDWLRRASSRPAAGRPRAPGLSLDWAWDALTYLARRNGFAVSRADCGGAEALTAWRDRRIRVHGEATSAQAVTALAHQIGHMFLHGEIARLEASATVPCHGIRKVEADSVAYLVAAHLGIHTPAITFPRISSWAGTDPRAHPGATIQAVSGRILATASLITAHLDAEHGVGRESLTPGPAASAAVDEPAGHAAVSRGDLVRAHETAAQFFCGQLPDSWVPEYLNARGFGPAVQRQWRAGYAPARWDALTTNLRAAGYPDTLIEAAGLARRSRRGTLIDTFRDRAMLPIHADDGTVVAFIGRASPQAGPGVPKYLNSPRTDLYDKSSMLFGLWQGRAALAGGARPVITEGPFDAIAVTTSNPSCYAGLAPCGTALTTRQLNGLDGVVGLRVRGVLVAFDSDEAGRRAAVKAYHLLSPLTDRAEAVIFPAGQDPAQFLNDHGRIVLAETLADRVRPLADLVIEAEVTRWDRWLTYAEGQIHALRAAAPIIAALPPAQVGRQVARLAHRLGLDHVTVTEAVTDAVTELVAAGRAGSGPGAGLADGEPKAAALTGERYTSQDFPHTAQQVTAQAATTALPPGHSGAAGADRGRLIPPRVLR